MQTLIFDYGHGINTAGKRSPDGRLREYKYVREIGQSVVDLLTQLSLDFDIRILVPEETDISLTERVRRCNAIVKSSANPCYLVSIHVDAAGSGTEWLNARGWSVFVSNNASQTSKDFAGAFFDAATELDLKTRQYKPNQKYWQANYKILRETNCPAILTENFFQDNKEDVDFLLSREGRDAVTNIHVLGILDYFKIPHAYVSV